MPPPTESVYPSPQGASAAKRTILSWWSTHVYKQLGKVLNTPPNAPTIAGRRESGPQAAPPDKCHFLCLFTHQFKAMRKFHSKTFIAQ